MAPSPILNPCAAHDQGSQKLENHSGGLANFAWRILRRGASGAKPVRASGILEKSGTPRANSWSKHPRGGDRRPRPVGENNGGMAVQKKDEDRQRRGAHAR